MCPMNFLYPPFLSICGGYTKMEGTRIVEGKLRVAGGQFLAIFVSESVERRLKLMQRVHTVVEGTVHIIVECTQKKHARITFVS